MKMVETQNSFWTPLARVQKMLIHSFSSELFFSLVILNLSENNSGNIDREKPYFYPYKISHLK